MSTTRSRTMINTLKPAALVLAGVVAGSMFSELLRPASALAQDSKTLPPEKVLNSAEQTMKMANGIAQINDKLTKLQSTLDGGLKVKVTEMPAAGKDSK
jgi:hypothetical protein